MLTTRLHKAKLYINSIRQAYFEIGHRFPNERD